MADNDRNDQSNGDADRAEVDAVLVEVDFPASRDDLVEAARDSDADEAVIVLFRSLPDEEYASKGDVDAAITDR